MNSTRLFLVLLGAVGFGMAACGGKVDLNFIGAPGSGAEGGDGTVSATCGDRKLDDNEDCDDGARADGDGCDGSCKLEEGYTCTGEPSTCVKCGNGSVEEAEECDDENTEAGDGCSPECKIEGSCETPLPIELKADKDGLVGSATLSTAAGEAGQVEAADCGATKAGAGPDRIFSFELPGAADVDVKVGAAFDAIVRITTDACDLATEVAGGCVDGAAVAGTETAHFDNMPAGKYFVVVDGKNAKASGSFSVDIEARCPLSGVKIDRVILQQPFRTVLFNTNQQCSVDLSRVGLYAQPEAADVPKTLPAVSLEPLKRRLLTSESPPPANTTYQGNIRFDLEDYAGALYLCRGACDTANGTNVIDAVRWAGAAQALSVDPPKAVHFDEDVPAPIDREMMSLFRSLTSGAFPNFSKNDWETAYFVETFEDGTLSGWNPPTALFYKPKFVKIEGTIGAFSLALEGGNPAAAVWNGPTRVFRNVSDGEIKGIGPSYVSYRVRGADLKANHGWVFFGRSGAEANGFGGFFRDNGTLGFPSPPTKFLAYKIETWYLVEFKNFDRVANTVEVFVDGKTQGTIALGTAALNQISLRSTTADSTFWIDQIIVR
jgi:cysteine-rich repeat protein